MFEIITTIYSNSERSEQFLKHNIFQICYWRSLQIYYSGTIKMPIGTKHWIVETYWNKLEKKVSVLFDITIH